MDPLVPISGLSLERYAELSAEVATARGDAVKIHEILARAGLPLADWERAHAGWSARLADPAYGLSIAVTFEERYHSELDRLLGAPPDIPPEDFAAMLGEALASGLRSMGERRGVTPLSWSRIAYRSRVAAAEEPHRLAACLAFAGQLAERRVAGLVPATPLSPLEAKERAFGQDATVAAKAVGKAVVSGLGAFGSAIDSVGKSLLGPAVGARVLVHWSDGNKYPGTVAQLENGKCLVTMSDGAQHWIPEAFVKPV